MYYYSFSDYCKNTFGKKCYKIALDAHMSCPNRDGTIGTGGCIFCSKGGSGDFAIPLGDAPVIDRGISIFGSKNIGEGFIAYFQSFTNTYAPVEYLEKVYRQALDTPQFLGISIATRPDCLGDEVLSLLSRLKTDYPDKFIWIELGLQTIHEQTALYIRRGYTLPVFEDAMKRLKANHLPVIVHLILGLPGETAEMIYESVSYLNRFKPFGIKLQLLHILKDTDLYLDYEKGLVPVLSKEEYIDLIIGCLERLDPSVVIHRLTGDGPKAITVAPAWSFQKKDVLNSLHREMKLRQTCQGRLVREGELHA